METTLSTRRELTQKTAGRYRKTDRKNKIVILNEFCSNTGYNRDYAATLFRTNKYTVKKLGKTKQRKKSQAPKKQGGRPVKYGKEIQRILIVLWKRFDFLCAKRFVPLIRGMLSALSKNLLLGITPAIADALKQISPATVDRLLVSARKKYKLSGHSYTRSGTSLKDLIPVRTFDEWKDCPPGHEQIDTVGHDGGKLAEDCSFTLCMTDVCTGWTERYAMQNRAFKWVHQGLDQFRASMPFPIIHLHPDGGSEFINMGLIAYCKKPEHLIDLTRSRPGKKNDNCYVEQKNFDTIRKLIGYTRYSSPAVISLLNELYRVHWFLQNYFYPSQKLISKIRLGSKIKKLYDVPRCPADRLLTYSGVPIKIKRNIRTMKASLDPLHLSNEVDRLLTAIQTAMKTVSLAEKTKETGT